MAKAILLAEDSQDDEGLFKHTMKKVGLENPLIVVRDGRETIALLEGAGKYADRKLYPRPHVLFLDLKMPEVDGFAVLEWLKDRPAVRDGLLIVVLTHYGKADDIRRAYALGANSFLVKPFSKSDWESLIQHFDGYWVRS